MLFHFQKDVFCLLYTMTEFFPWLREKKIIIFYPLKDTLKKSGSTIKRHLHKCKYREFTKRCKLLDSLKNRTLSWTLSKWNNSHRQKDRRKEASKKAITECWPQSNRPTNTLFRHTVKNLHAYEQLTYAITLQKEVGEKRWEKWLLFSPQKLS